MFTVDLHAHTRFFHGFRVGPTPFDPIGGTLLSLYGGWKGLDGVTLTNHDYYADIDTVANGVQFIPGIEITTTDGHVLVIGPDPPTRTRPGALTPREAVSLAHERGCAAIIPHPFRRGTVRDSGADFDAVEINGKDPKRIERVRELADALDLPIVGGSDAHFPFEAGRAFTRIDAARLTHESVVDAIRDGRVEPYVRGSRADGLLQAGYRCVHRYVR
jgi:predicted metal-dependent phosphoesterase TrpH